MHLQANTMNIINDHLLLSGSDHDWFPSGNSDSRFVDALEFTADFLYPLLPCNTLTSINNEETPKKNIRKIIDVIGREVTKKSNSLLFFIYEDGSVHKQLIID